MCAGYTYHDTYIHTYMYILGSSSHETDGNAEDCFHLRNSRPLAPRFTIRGFCLFWGKSKDGGGRGDSVEVCTSCFSSADGRNEGTEAWKASGVGRLQRLTRLARYYMTVLLCVCLAYVATLAFSKEKKKPLFLACVYTAALAINTTPTTNVTHPATTFLIPSQPFLQ